MTELPEDPAFDAQQERSGISDEAYRYMAEHRTDTETVAGAMGRDGPSPAKWEDVDVLNERDFTGLTEPNDPSDGHNVEVIGMYGSKQNDIGKASLSESDVVVAQFASEATGQMNPVRVRAAMEWLVDQGVDAISLSWSFGAFFGHSLYEGIKYARENGVLVVTSAGNEGTNKPRLKYPGTFDFPNLLTVGSADADFTNFGDFVDIAVGGEGSVTYIPDDLFRDENDNPDLPWELVIAFGTSFKGPEAMDVCLAMPEVQPYIKGRPGLIKGLLMAAAKDPGLSPAFEGVFGAGEMDALAALKAANDPLGFLGMTDGSTPSLPATENAPAHFEVYRRTDGEYGWRLRAGNGRIIATDHQNGYSRKDDAYSGLRNFAGAFTEEKRNQHTLTVEQDTAGDYWWKYVHQNGNIIATSGEGYDTERGARRALAVALFNAADPRTSIDDMT